MARLRAVRAVRRDVGSRGEPVAGRPVPVPRAPVTNAALGRVLRSAAVGRAGGPAPPGMEQALRTLGAGSAVPHAARRTLEDGLGTSLADVRVHAGGTGSTLATQIGAEAFTVGRDVVLGGGVTDVDSPAGYHLLAHEVVHTLQPSEPTGGDLVVGAADSPLEREADEIASALVAHRFSGPAPVASDVGAPRQGPTGPRGVDRTVRRFERDEHERLGDAAGDDIDLGGGVVLTWGQVVGLAGDEFGTLDDLREMARTNPAELRRILTSDSIHSPQYETLLLTNFPHFVAGGTAVSTWESHHAEALYAAVMAGVHADDTEYQDAMLVEAFGQHFLTDSFSSGHIRTPRIEVIEWYESTFVPRVMPALVAQLRQRLRDGFTAQLNSQLVMPESAIRALVDAAMGAALRYFEDELRTEVQPLLGQGIAGAISGTLHDRDNFQGLWVASDAHPDPWFAYGDGRLTCSPETLVEAQAAVVTARDELVAARALGERRRDATAPRPRPLGAFEAPEVVHFAFDSAVVDAAGAVALQEVADYLVSRPELVVRITGHTDPLGTDDYNDSLGARRADAVAELLMQRGVPPHRLSSRSAGERMLLSTDRSGYRLDRRAQLEYIATRDAPEDEDWAIQAIADRFPGPPYATVERYLPREVPGRNTPQEDWRWGTMTSEMAADIDTWLGNRLSNQRSLILTTPHLDPQHLSVPDLGVPAVWPGPPITMRSVTIDPRPIALAFFDEFMAGRTAFLGGLFGVPAANRSVPPLPAPVPCTP